MIRGSARLFHSAAHSSSSPFVRRLWMLCNKRPDLPLTAKRSPTSHNGEPL
jgi:hypothetical protein